MKKIFFLALVSLVLVSCNLQESSVSESSIQTETTTNSSVEENTSESENSEEKISVTTSIIPLASVAHTIGGDFVEVQNIIPAGISPHGFDMSARDMAGLEDTQRIFMLGLDHIDGFLKKTSNPDKQIHLADGMELIEIAPHDHHDNEKHNEEDHHEEGHHDEHDHGHDDTHDHEHEEEHHEEHDHSSDPHVWLGKENIIEIAENIRDELTEILPEQAEYFSENTQKFSNELEEIFEDFETEVTGKTPREFIVFHDAYNYLFESIGLDTNLKVPFSENVLHETGTAHMAELIDEIELHGITHIFREPQFSDSSLQKFTDEYSLSVHTLDPLGADSSATGYLTNLRNNLAALKNIYE